MHNLIFSQLDDVWINDGISKCREFFKDSLRSSRALGLRLINDTRVTFPCFFILLPVIQETNVLSSLKQELKEAFDFAQNILKHDHFNTDDPLKSKTILKWILDSSYRCTNLGQDFNEIIDVTASLLVNQYNDLASINKIANLIFLRNRNGENIHDLVWCFFQVNTIQTIRAIALRLNSTNVMDIKLARKLLNYNSGSYNDFISNINKNETYIYFTGESFQYSSRPIFYRVDYSCKYLCKRRRTVVFSNEEKSILNKFKELSEEEQDILSEYSFVLSKTNKQKWEEFMSFNMSQQLQKAKDGALL